MVAVLTLHVRHVENARGWPFVFKNFVFLKLGFVVSYYVWINKLDLMTVAMQLLFEL